MFGFTKREIGIYTYINHNMKKTIKQDIDKENREYTKLRLAREKQNDQSKANALIEQLGSIVRGYDKEVMIELAENEIVRLEEFIKKLNK